MPASALVLNWSGSYKLEEEFIQNVGEGGYHFHLLHNLNLQPDIKVFDGFSVHSWFQLAPSANFYQNYPDPDFYYQNGVSFGFTGVDSVLPVPLELRDLYLHVTYDFGVLEIGWKPHHFGLGMYYNDGSDVFSPTYNRQGSRGMFSWKGFLGSTYYVQPMVHYIDDLLVSFFIEGGLKKQQYGVSGIYKSDVVGSSSKKSLFSTRFPSYLGVYAYYHKKTLSVQVEAGKINTLYGSALKLDWRTPWKKLTTNFNIGISTSDSTGTFYFDPNFSSLLSFLIERYVGFKTPAEDYLRRRLFYSFHSALYLSPSVSFALWDFLDLSSVFSIHLSYPLGDILLNGVDVILKYKQKKGWEWINRLGFLFPSDDNWHIGINSGIAIGF